MDLKRAIKRVIAEGCKVESYKGQNVRFIHFKQPRNNGLGFWSAIDCLKNHFGFKIIGT